ncbi:MAG: hypothetical protein A3G03_01785 [Candidatus Taylorbacteria bacterium RIFCSPLOWO2_12_FULL_44_15c]|uniref:DUF4258 domain-containing protein n=1 Tax=Candidatus Taylorbacteria bacterium RIFCSPLOWO2_12_FULL_44_15c TaxID=1802333 RepID=A0A1G2P9C4_9BACT|nr:MAG: hypothetical protein A3G03_01785 [Candidatus Taylorbacteria bacterium RIFCSPLOWO2_12_FULL_44_15c]
MIIFTKHAGVKLTQRKISKILVTRTIESPDSRFKSRSNRIIFYKKFGRLYLSVIIKTEKNYTIVITAYWVAKIKKS